MGRTMEALGLAGALALTTAASCTSGNGSEGTGGTSSTPGFGSSACGQCVHQSCTAEIASCGADPECAAYLSCLDGCPVAADGDVETSCEQACPRGSGSSAQAAINGIALCRTTGGAAGCAACGTGSGGGGSWILQQQCPTSAETNACYKCEDEHCCQTYASYAESPEAVAYKQCLTDCVNAQGQACFMTCYQEHPDGIERFAPRWACVSLFCGDADACGTLPLTSCELCTNEQCAEPYVALVSDPTGYLLWSCALDCPDGDLACMQACSAEYPSAQPLLEAFLACSATSCGAECG
jgi:hypothetical protein